MRSHCSVFVDAGYLLASIATRVTGTSLRSGIHVEYRRLIEALIAQAQELSGLPVLRVHWYDSAKNAVPDAQQERIGELPKVKLRLGRFGVDGQQKGVDLRLGLDLVTHARNGAADVFVLVSGDDDLTEAVEESQVHGVQVVVMAVPTVAGKAHGVSRHLVRAADELVTLSPDAIDGAVMKVEAPAEPASATTARPAPVGPTPKDIASSIGRPTSSEPRPVVVYSSSTGSVSRPTHHDDLLDDPSEVVAAVVDRVLQSLERSATAESWSGLERGRPSIPREIDKALLLDASDALGIYDLSDHTRYELRDQFWNRYDEIRT
ncbi:NYN domain-containing protein [Luteimicrobium subarcticum]|uniref:NYN domain-containing protein n=1 Tax=Luteimicrobium subarcticum TaxID=620910 RepID=UPI000C23F097|nr:NYN domain-containing protein [Luteimicrobium subarcticum]